MSCKKSTIRLLILLLCLLNGKASFGQGADSLYKVPNSPFLAKIISIVDLNTSINLSDASKIIPLNNSILASNAQLLMKHGNDIYVLIEQTGIVYKLMRFDINFCEFKRIDHTVNLNYNINCKNFIYNNELYSYGGYGFWKTNGNLRKFNNQDSEWDIIPLNKEVISTYYLWFSEKQGRLYLPYQKIVNAGIAGPENISGVPIYTSYYLDLKTNKWEKLGNLEKSVIEIVKNDNTSSEYLAYSEGLLHLVNDDAYLFDYVHNKVYKSKNADLNQFLIRRAKILDMFIYKDQIYSYQSGKKEFITYPLKLNDFELLRTSIWGSELMFYYLLSGVLAITMVIIFSIWFFNRSVKRKLQIEQLKILRNKSITQAFTVIEIALIKVLLNASKKNEPLEIHHINHVLGLKEKNVGLQKKVRSDVIKSINDKYEFITQTNISLIGSSRKLDDKRFYEYFITPSELSTIQRIIEKIKQ